MTSRELKEQLQLVMQGRAPDGYSWWEVVGALLKANDGLRDALNQIGTLVEDTSSGGICDQPGWYALMNELEGVIKGGYGDGGDS